MTISSSTRKAGPFSGTGTAGPFTFAFKVFVAADLYVVRLHTSSGVETVLTLDTDYTVSLNADQNAHPGGTVTLVAALDAGYTLTLASVLDYTQETHLTNQGGFYPEVMTNALDKLTILTQQLKESDDRTLKISVTTPDGVSTQLPAPAANKVVGWDNTGVGLRNWDVNDLVTTTAYGTAVADIFTGDNTTTAFTLSYDPANINNLDVSVGGVTQVPGVDYVWTSGVIMTFTTAPPTGATILARYMRAVAQGSIDWGSVGSRPFTDTTIYINNTMSASALYIGIEIITGGSFVIASGAVFTIDVPFTAPLAQVFSGSGSVVFSTGSVTEVYPEWWGAVADGTTDDSVAITAASNSGCKTLALTQTYNANNANITALNLTIHGGGTIKNGLLIGPSGTTPSEMHIVVKGLRFAYSSLASNQPGITLRNCRYHTITQNVFVNCDKSILYTNVNVNQNCNRGIITDNVFNNVNYCIYNDVTGISVTYLVGDITFSNNQSYARITHLYLPKQDGAVIKGNTLFFPGYQVSDSTKQRHIDSVKSSMLIVSGNQLFEAGLESIYLDECGITEISSNNIIWSGQRVQSYAIQIVRSGSSATTQQNIIINNNIISGASSGGIDLGTNNGTGSIINYAAISNNTITMLGGEMSTQYYGSAITGSLYYISCKSTNNRITYTSNRCFSASGSVGVGSIQYPTISSSYNNTYTDNVIQEETTANIVRDKTSSRQLTTASTTVELDATGYDAVAWSPGTATTCRSIKSGVIGNELIIYAGNGNLTLDHQSVTTPTTGYSLLILKSNADVTLSSGQMVVLRFMNTTGTARWFEISRNF